MKIQAKVWNGITTVSYVGCKLRGFKVIKAQSSKVKLLPYQALPRKTLKGQLFQTLSS
jgi:hypothetical protein